MAFDFSGFMMVEDGEGGFSPFVALWMCCPTLSLPRLLSLSTPPLSLSLFLYLQLVYTNQVRG